LSEMAKELGYEVEVSWASSKTDGSYEVLLWRSKCAEGAKAEENRRRERAKERLVWKWEQECARRGGGGVAGQEWTEYANNPAREQLSASVVDELENFVRDRVPEYMAPGAYVVLKEMPWTPNGKIDRRSLPSPEAGRGSRTGNYVGARTATEDVLTSIWGEVLRAEKIGVEDDFFRMGGHSLLATQVISRVNKIFKVNLRVRNMFEAPTVARFAQVIAAARKGDFATSEKELVPISREGELPLSFAQQRLWFLDQLEPGNPFYNMAFVLRIIGYLNVEALKRSFNEMLSRHEALRTSFPNVGGEPKQVIHPVTFVSLPVLDLSHLPKQEQEREARRLAQEEVRLPFNLAQGPLIRLTLLGLDKATEWVVLLTMHHIVSDGWSMGLFIQEIAALYDAFSVNSPSPLEELPIQYADFAYWQRQWLSGDVLERQLDYWKKQLGDELPVLELPTDRPRPLMQTFNGATLTHLLPKQLSEAVKTLNRQQGVTLFMTLLAVFQTLMSRYTGQDDIIV